MGNSTTSSDEGADWDGLISDESSFYGDEDEKQRWESLAANFDADAGWTEHQKSIGYITAKAQRATTTPFPSISKRRKEKPRLYNPYSEEPSARQLNEDVSAFLERLPPRTTSSVAHGPWIKIANPYSSWRPTQSDLAGLTQSGQQLLSGWAGKKTSIEQRMAKNAQSAVKSAVTRERKGVEETLLNIAREKKCTTGKWMLFPAGPSINEMWTVIAEATANNTLGISAKVATAAENSDDRSPRMICIYTQDFGEKADVKRVLERLVELGVVNKRDKKSVYYKCDAYTHLGISSGNEWGFPASLYASHDLLDTKKKPGR